jgi:hypothetical protein
VGRIAQSVFTLSVVSLVLSAAVILGRDDMDDEYEVSDDI